MDFLCDVQRDSHNGARVLPHSHPPRAAGRSPRGSRIAPKALSSIFPSAPLLHLRCSLKFARIHPHAVLQWRLRPARSDTIRSTHHCNCGRKERREGHIPVRIPGDTMPAPGLWPSRVTSPLGSGPLCGLSGLLQLPSQGQPWEPFLSGAATLRDYVRRPPTHNSKFCLKV